MDKNNQWAPETIREAPYWEDGMTPSEYDAERHYYLTHYEDIRSGKIKYVPLSQRGEKQK